MPRLLALLLALTAGSAQAAEVVRLGNLRQAHHVAVAAMQERCRRFGLEVRERVFATPADLFWSMSKGELDLAASPATAAIAERAHGGRILVVAGLGRGGARLVGRTDLPLRAVGDLKGHRVGVTRGDAAELLLLAELYRARLTWSERPGLDVQIVDLPAAELNLALQRKEIDAMCQAEPQATQALDAGFGTELQYPYDTRLGEPVRVLVMTERLRAERPAAAARVLECLLEATRHYQREPALVERWLREQVLRGQPAPRDLAEAMANAPLGPEVTAEHVQVTTDLMVNFGLGGLTTPPRAADWVRLDLLERARARLGPR